MRASKENCEKVIQLLQRKQGFVTVANRDFVMDFMKAAKKRLPTELAIDNDEKRKKAKKRGS